LKYVSALYQEYIRLQPDGSYKLVAQTLTGMEEILAKEIAEQGGTEIEKLRRAVRFSADQETLIKCNLWCRTAVRISTEITHFTISSVDDMYEQLYDMTWERIIRIVLKVFNNDCSVLMDSSGTALFKRGYRQRAYVAPMNECLAAGLILLSDWDQESDFMDPFCGSGTIPIEAAMIALNIPPNHLRERFGFMSWPEYDEEIYDKVREEISSHRKVKQVRIHAMDISIKAMEQLADNARIAKIPEGVITTKQLNFFDIREPFENVKCIVMNPPYDERIDLMNAEDFYSKIGDQFKTYFKGCNAWVLSANLKALKRVGLRPSRKISLQNGPLDCKFMKYEMYAGSKKASKQPKD